MLVAVSRRDELFFDPQRQRWPRARRKFATAGHRRQHARRVRYPEFRRHIDHCMSTDQNFEDKLETWRREAKHGGGVTGRGVDVTGGPIPKRPGYFGEAVVRPPVWTWEIPLYFFIGGAAGMAPLFACAGFFLGMLDLARVALWIAAAGAIISPILLVMDLGRPQLFINMLRVFKYQSPMSVGSWILSLFGIFTVPAGPAFRALSQPGLLRFGRVRLILVLAILLTVGSALSGVLLATYTGVLIGVTVIPAWFLHRVLLADPFRHRRARQRRRSPRASRVSDSSALLDRTAGRYRRDAALDLAGNRQARRGRPRPAHGRTGWLIRGGEILHRPARRSFLRLTNLIPLAALSFLAGRFSEPLRLDCGRPHFGPRSGSGLCLADVKRPIFRHA